MRWKADADVVVGVAVGTGRKNLGFGFGVSRRTVVKKVGIDHVKEGPLRRFHLFVSKGPWQATCDWSSTKRNCVCVDRTKRMRHASVLNVLLQMIPSSLQEEPVDQVAADEHWSFLEEVDAPQWIDLLEEGALMGTQGDDPWFHQRHSHHETSLVLLASLSFAGRSIVGDQPHLETSGNIAHDKRQLPSAKAKPNSKASVVKACLGGMQRVSIAGPQEVRLSSRPKIAVLSSKQSRARNTKKAHAQRPDPKRTPAATVGSVSRPASGPSEQSVTVENSTKSNATIGHLSGTDPETNTQEVGKSVEHGEIGRSGLGLGSDRSVTQTGHVSPASDRSDNGLESGRSPTRRYRLPSPPNKGALERDSSIKDVVVSSDRSPTKSNSSQESMNRIGPASSAVFGSKMSDFDHDTSEITEKKTSRVKQLVASAELRSRIPQLADRCDVQVYEPSLETSPPEVDRDLLNEDDKHKINPDRNHQASNRRLKRRSLGTMRVKQIEKAGSIKKKSSDKLTENESVVVPDRLVGAQSTHPILEKLRKSWGSALRVKQRRDAEVEIRNAGVDSCTSDQKPSADVQKVGGEVLCSRCSAQPALCIRCCAEPISDGKHISFSGVLHLKELDSFESQAEVERRAHSRGAISQSGDAESESQLLRGPPPAEAAKTGDMGAADCARSSNLKVKILGEPGKSSTPSGAPDTKSEGNVPAPASQTDRAKMSESRRHQRSKSDVTSKFKKQYAHAEYAYTDSGLSRSSSIRRDKENVNSETLMKAPTVSPTAAERKRKTNLAKSLNMPASSAKQLGQPVEPASISKPAINVERNSSSPLTRTVLINNADLVHKKSRKIEEDAAKVTAGKGTELFDKKLNSVAAFRSGSSISLPKFGTLKSQNASPSVIREVTRAGTGLKGCRAGGLQVADESTSAFLAEERKAKRAVQYEPRLHNLKAIKEWEGKSGKRYYDLQPTDREMANKEIAAALKTTAKRISA